MAHPAPSSNAVFSSKRVNCQSFSVSWMAVPLSEVRGEMMTAGWRDSTSVRHTDQKKKKKCFNAYFVLHDKKTPPSLTLLSVSASRWLQILANGLIRKSSFYRAWFMCEGRVVELKAVWQEWEWLLLVLWGAPGIFAALLLIVSSAAHLHCCCLLQTWRSCHLWFGDLNPCNDNLIRSLSISFLLNVFLSFSKINLQIAVRRSGVFP